MALDESSLEAMLRRQNSVEDGPAPEAALTEQTEEFEVYERSPSPGEAAQDQTPPAQPAGHAPDPAQGRAPPAGHDPAHQADPSSAQGQGQQPATPGQAQGQQPDSPGQAQQQPPATGAGQTQGQHPPAQGHDQRPPTPDQGQDPQQPMAGQDPYAPQAPAGPTDAEDPHAAPPPGGQESYDPLARRTETETPAPQEAPRGGGIRPEVTPPAGRERPPGSQPDPAPGPDAGASQEMERQTPVQSFWTDKSDPEAPAEPQSDRPKVFTPPEDQVTMSHTGQETTRPESDAQATGTKMGRPRIALVQSDFNAEVTDVMADWAKSQARRLNATVTHHIHVPGVYDLPLTAKTLARRDDVDAIVVVGAVIQGETGHDEVITTACATQLAAIAYDTEKPVGFGVTGPRMTAKQAEQRIVSGKHAVEAAVTQWRTLQGLRD